MKGTLRFAAVVISTAILKLSAQTSPELALQTYAGLNITGTVGAVYAVECVPELAQTNNPSAWRCLEYMRLPSSPYLWVGGRSRGRHHEVMQVRATNDEDLLARRVRLAPGVVATADHGHPVAAAAVSSRS